MQEGLQERLIEATEYLPQPEITRYSLLQVKAVGSRGIKHEMKAEFDEKQGMFEEKASEVAGVDQAFADADQEGFEVGGFWMSRSPRPECRDSYFETTY
jgi:hypothetical protein